MAVKTQNGSGSHFQIDEADAMPTIVGRVAIRG